MGSESSESPLAIQPPDTTLTENTNAALVFRVAKTKGIETAVNLRDRLNAAVASSDGTYVKISTDVTDVEDGFRVRLTLPRSYAPGKFRVQLQIDTLPGASRTVQHMFRQINGATDGMAMLFDRTIPLGMTAANVLRRTLVPGETLDVHMATSDGANPDCGSNLAADVQDPDGSVWHASVFGGTIQTQQSCAVRKFTVLPDYAFSRPLSQQGAYAITVTPPTSSGQTLQTSVDVRKDRLLDIHRSSVTRTFPGNTESMVVLVNPAKTFVGTVTETVPAGFDVVTVEPLATKDVNPDGTLSIIWERRWEAGIPVELRYTYTTPSTVPLFATFGPLEAKGTLEVTGLEQSSSSVSSESSVSSPESSQSSASSESSAVASSVSSESSASSESPVSSSPRSPEGEVGPAPRSPEGEVGPAPRSPEGEVGSASSKSSASSSESSASSASSTSSPSPLAGDLLRTVNLPTLTASPDILRGVRELLRRIFDFFSFFSPRTFVGAIVGEKGDFTFRAEEQAPWQVLSLPIPLSQKPQNAQLSLTPRGSDTFDANTPPAFTILHENVTGNRSEIIDAEGHLKETKAMEKIAEAITDPQTVHEQILSALITDQSTAIASALVQDSTAVNALAAAGDIAAERTKAQRVEALVRDTLQDNDGAQKAVAEQVLNDAKARDALALLATPEVKAAVVQDILHSRTGSSATVGAKLEENPILKNIAQGALLDSLTGNAERKESTAKTVAEQVVKSAFEREGSSSSASLSPGPANLAGSSASLITLKLTDKNGRTFAPKYHFQTGSVVLVLEPDRRFTPGLYELEMTVTNPLTGETSSYTQDFAWGVLAMNPDQDVYAPGDPARIDIGVLNDAGGIVCDAKLRLSVKTPGGETFALSTDDHSIVVTGTCGKKEAGLLSPDYETFMTLAEAGRYALTLEAATANGTRSITSSLEVREDAPVAIRRKAATRLWPYAPSTMTLHVTFRSGFTGTVRDTVPEEFRILDATPDATVTSSPDTGEKRIAWKGSWSAGETAELTYVYDAPDISPQFYLMGPAELATAKETTSTEARSWQIANDAESTTVTGRAFSDQGTTPLNGATVAVSLNGDAGVTAVTNAAGWYTATVTRTLTGGSIVSAYLSGNATKAVTLWSGCGGYVGGAMTGITLYGNTLIVRGESGSTPLSNAQAKIGAANNSGDISAIYAVDGSNNLALAGAASLYVWQGKNFRPGGTVTTTDLTIRGSLDMQGNAFSVAGNWDAVPGSSTGSNTVTFTATSGTKTITGSGGWNNVTFNGNGGTFVFSRAATIGGNLTVTAGALRGSGSITVKGGSVTGNGTIALTNGVFTVLGTGDFGGATDWTFASLRFGDGVATGVTSKNGANAVTATNTLVISPGHTLQMGTGTWNLQWGGHGLLEDVKQIVSSPQGTTSYALKSDGSRVYAWGTNTSGQLGNNATLSSSTPVAVAGVNVTDGSHYLGEGGSYGGPISQIAAGQNAGYALKSDGSRVYAWGDNTNGQLGINSTAQSNIPVSVYGLTITDGSHLLGEGGSYGGPISQIAAANNSAYALKSDGSRVYAWGLNGNGQLGINSTAQSNIPVSVYGLGITDGSHFLGEGGSYGGPISQIAAGQFNGYALKSDGSRVYAWGDNSNGQLGINSTAQSKIPVQVYGLGITDGSHLLGEGGSYGGPVSQIAAGSFSAYALKSDGSRVYAWGLNGNGQLGINSTAQSLIPVQVYGLGIGDGSHFLGEGGSYGGPISQIAAGGYWSAYALKSDGSRVYAWGYNANGQLGINSTTRSLIPVRIYGVGVTNGLNFLGEGGSYGGPISQIAGGYATAYAIKSDGGRAYAWGYNANGQLGVNSTAQSTIPVQVFGTAAKTGLAALRDIKQIVSGSSSAYALRSDGARVYAWGSNANGQLGINSTTASNVPLPVYGVGITDGSHFLGEGGAYGGPISQIAAGADNNAYALKSDGSRVYAWGYGYWGQLGNYSSTQSNIPVQVYGVGITNGTHFLGEGGSYGGPISQIAAGADTAYALKSDGSRVYSWGYNFFGSLGINSTAHSNIPVPVWGLGVSDGSHFLGEGGSYGGPVSQIAASGYYSAYALKSDGSRVYAWGRNAYGQIGIGSTLQQNLPVQVWGVGVADGSHFLGEGGSYGGPVSQIAGGKESVYALKSDGTRVYAWGYNGNGQLGINNTTQKTTPVAVYGVGDTSGTHFLGEGGSYGGPIGQIAGGTYTAYAMQSDGSRVYAWGDNTNGQLGNNATTQSNIPLTVYGVGVTNGLNFLGEGGSYGGPLSQIAGGYGSAYALKSDGSRVYALGLNASGQLGNNTTAQSTIPLVSLMPLAQPIASFGSLVPQSATVRFVRVAPVQPVTAGTLLPGATYRHLTLADNAQNFVASGALAVQGDLQVTGGRIVVGEGLTLSGSLILRGTGSLVAGQGTVTLSGGSQTLSGALALWNLTKQNNSGNTLSFAAGKTVTVSGALVLRGKTGTPMLIRSTVNGSAANLVLDGDAGTQTLDYLNVQDNSAAGGATIQCVTGCVDGGNTVNWQFPVTTVTGRAFSDQGVTVMNGVSVAVSLNGGAAARATTNAAGWYTVTISRAQSGGSILSAYLSGSTVKAVTAWSGCGTLVMTGVNLYGNTLIVRGESGASPITNAKLSTAKANGSADLTAIYSVTNNDLTLASGKSLWVWAGKSYSPGGRIAGAGLTNQGTLSMGTSGLTLTGSLVTSAGTFTTGTGITILPSTGNRTLTMGGNATRNLTLDDGLIGYWKFDETAAGTFADSGPFRRTGIGYGAGGANNTPQPTSSRPSGIRFYDPRAVSTDGTDDYVDLGTFAIPTTGSICTWWKPDQNPMTLYQPIFNTRDPVATYKLFDLYPSGGRMYAGWYATITGTTYNSRINWLMTGVSQGIWYHLCLTWKPGTSTVLYLNSSVAASTGTYLNSYWDTTGQHSYIGKDGYNGSNLGALSVDDMRLYNRVLSPSEISRLGGGYPSTASGTVTLGSSLTVSGSLILNGTLLDASASNFGLTVKGGWKNAGDYIARSGTVTLGGANQTLSGSTAFWNLAKTVSAAAALTFDAKAVQTVSGALTLRGVNGNLLSIRSSANATQAKLTLDGDAGTQTVDYLDVKDSDASGGQQLICFTVTEGCANSGNTSNWKFEQTTVTGQAFSGQGSGPINGATVAVSLNGAAAVTAVTNAAGWYTATLTRTLTGGSIVSAYLSGNATKAVTVWSGCGGYANQAMTGITLYGNTLIVRGESGSSPITNAKVKIGAGNGSSDISAIYSVSAGNDLTLVTGKSLWVWAGKSYTPGGRISGAGLTNQGTLSMGTNGLTLTGSLVTNAGTFTTSTGTTLLPKGSNTLTLGGNSVANLTINPTVAESGLVGWWKFEDVSPNDTFASTVDGTRWRQNGAGTATIISGQLDCNVGSTTAWATSGVDSNGKWVLRGDFDVQVYFDATMQPNPGAGGLTATNLYVQGSSYWYAVYMYRYSDGNMYGGTWTTQTSSSFGTPGGLSTGYLRLVRTGTAMYAYTSANGSSWNGPWTISSVDTSDMYVVINAQNNTSPSQAAHTRFDYFTVNKGYSAVDSSNTGNGAATSTGTTFSATVPSVKFADTQSYAFNGSAGNRYMKIPGSATLDLQRLTISAWVYSTNYNQNGFIFEKTTNGNYNTQYSLFFEGANTVFRTYNAGATMHNTNLTSLPYVTNSAWHHVAATYDGAYKRIYVDGLERTSTAYSQTLATNSAGTSWIGTYGGAGSYYFNGNMDDLRVYSRALSSAEIGRMAAGYLSATQSTAQYTLGSALTVGGTLQLLNGTLDTSSYNVSVAGGFENRSGTGFVARTNTVTLNGTNQNLSGSTMFWNLTKTVSAAATLTVDVNAIQTVSGALTLRGVNGNLLSIRSSRTGSGARLFLDGDAGSQTIDYLNVKDADASGGQALVCTTSGEGCMNTANNTNWLFSAISTTTTLASSLNPSTYGASVTLTATVSPAAGGTVTFKDGAATLGTATLGRGSGTLTLSSLAVGSHSLTAEYGGNGDYAASTSTPLSQTVNKANTTTTVDSSLNPSTYGSGVTLTATVTPSAATGTVTFKDGGVSIGTASLGQGSGTLTLNTLGVGSHSLTAVYGGNSDYSGSTSTPLIQTVSKRTPTVTLVSSPNPSTFGSGVTLTVTVSPSSPAFATGTVTFKDGSTTIGTATLGHGSGTFTTMLLTYGSHALTAVYAGNSDYNGSTSNTVNQTVNAAGTTTALVSSLNPSTYGNSVTLTATVSPPDATGTVTFKDGASTIGTAAVGHGSGKLTLSTLNAAIHSLTAEYGGDANYGGSTSGPLLQTVNKANTTTTLASSLNPSTYGSGVTLTATVSPSSPAFATGTVTFKDGATTLGTATLGHGSGKLTLNSLSAGSHTLTAEYGGNSNYNGSTSSTVTQTANKANTTTTLTSSLNPSTYGSGVTLTATVSPSSPAFATGTVTFKDGNSTIGTAILGHGSGSFALNTLAAGNHSLTAVYGGNSDYNSSTSNAVTQIVTVANSSTVLVSSLNPSTYGSGVALTATVNPSSPAFATGTVTFKDGAATIGTTTLGHGSGSMTLNTLGAGNHSLTAVYGGNSDYNGSTSNTVSQTVSKRTPTVTLVSSPNPSTFGSGVTLTVTVSPSSPAFATGTVTFKDGGATIGSVTLGHGSGSFTTMLLTYGWHTLTADYGGDANTQAAVSEPVLQNVNTRARTTTTLSSSQNPSSYGTTLTLTATVSTSAPVFASGTVTFKDGVTALGTATLGQGSGSITINTLKAGSHSLTAEYAGNSNFEPSTSDVLTQTVNKSATTTTIAAVPNPSIFGSSVTFTATVTPISPAFATGTVAFKEGGTTLGTATLGHGSGSFTTMLLTFGTHSVTAEYAGNADYNASTSAPVSQLVMVRISGTAYTDAGTTPLAGAVVRVAVDGAAAASSGVTAVDGTFTASLGPSALTANTVIAVYLSGNATKAATVLSGCGALTYALSGIDLYGNTLIVRGEASGSTLTNAQLSTAVSNGDAGLTQVYGVGGGSLTLASGKDLRVWPGKSFVPGGSVSAGSVTNRGTMTMAGNALTVSGSLLTAQGTFTTSATTQLTGFGSHTLTVGTNNLADLTIGVNGQYTLGSALAVNGDLTINGSLDVSPSNFDVTVGGNWTGTRGFRARSGTVTLSGTSQTLSGSTAFWNLTKTVTSTATLTLDANGAQTVSGALTLRGTAGNVLALRSTQNGVPAKLILDGTTGTSTLSFLDVRDSDARGGKLLVCYAGPNGCVDNGNTWNWLFGFAIRGTLYGSDGTGPIAGKRVAVSRNGGPVIGSGTTAGDGSYALYGIAMTGGSIMTFSVENDPSTRAAAVVLSSGNDMAGIDLYRNRLILRSESGSSPLTNATLAVARGAGNSGLTPILSSATASAVTVASGYELHLWPGDVFVPGGTVTVDDLDVRGTMDAAGNAVTINGSFSVGAGGNFVSTGTDTFAATSAGKTIALSGSTVLRNVVFDGAGGGWTLQTNLAASGVTLVNGTLTDNGKTVRVDGNLNIANVADLLSSTGTWEMSANGAVSNANAANAMATLRIDDGITATRGTDVAAGALVLGTASTLAGNGTLQLLPQANDFLDTVIGSSTITGGGVTVTLRTPLRTQKALFLPDTDLTIGNASGTTLRMTGDWTARTLNVLGNAQSTTASTATTLDANGNALSLEGNLLLGSSSPSAGGAYAGAVLLGTGTHRVAGDIRTAGSATAGMLDVGSATLLVDGNVNGTGIAIAPGTGTLVMNRTAGTQTLTSGTGGIAFHALTHSGAATVTVVGSMLKIDGNLTLRTATGTFDNGTNNAQVTVGGNVSASGGTLALGTATWTVGGSWNTASVPSVGNATVTMGGSGVTFGNRTGDAFRLTVGTGASVAVRTAANTVNALYVPGTLTVSTGATLTVTDAPLGSTAVTGLVTGGGTLALLRTSLTNYTGRIDVGTLSIGADSVALPAGIYGSRQVDVWRSAAGTGLRLTAGAYRFAGDLTLSPSSTMTIDATSAPSLTLEGNLLLNGNTAWNGSSAALAFTGSGAQTANVAGNAVGAVSVHKTLGSLTFAGSGTFASLTADAGTINFNRSAITTTGDLTLGGAAQINAVSLPGTALTVNGSLSMDRASAGNLNLAATGAWTLNVLGAHASVRHADVAFADARGGRFINAASSTNRNLGGNLHWDFGGRQNGAVWVDDNGNGIKDTGETTGLSGIRVTLAGTDAEGSPLSLQSTTTSTGAYAFDAVLASNGSGYTVAVDTSTVPAGYGNTSPTRATAQLLTGATLLTDFGYSQESTVTGYVFKDENKDGIRQPYETNGFSGATVSIAGTTSLGASYVRSMSTNGSGVYLFQNVPLSSGSYLLLVTPPASYVPTRTNSWSFVLTTGGQVILEDFGYTPYVPPAAEPPSGNPGGGGNGAASNGVIRVKPGQGSQGNEGGTPNGQGSQPQEPAKPLWQQLEELRRARRDVTVVTRLERTKLLQTALAGTANGATFGAGQYFVPESLRGVWPLLRPIAALVLRDGFNAASDATRQIALDVRTSLRHNGRVIARVIGHRTDDVRVALRGASDRLLQTDAAARMIAGATGLIVRDATAQSVAWMGGVTVRAGRIADRMVLQPGSRIASDTLSLMSFETQRMAGAVQTAGIRAVTRVAQVFRSRAERDQRHLALAIRVNQRKAARIEQRAGAVVSGAGRQLRDAGALALFVTGRGATAVAHGGIAAQRIAVQTASTLRTQTRDAGTLIGMGGARIAGAFAQSAVDNGKAAAGVAYNVGFIGVSGVREIAAISGRTAADLGSLAALGTERGIERSADGLAQIAVTLGDRVADIFSEGRNATSLIAQRVETIRKEPAAPTARPLPERQYTTQVFRKGQDTLIASLNLSISDIFGNPFRNTPVVLFSTPKIAVTNTEGIATFHEVETGEHALEIHVKPGVVERRQLVIEPPSGLTASEQKRVDVVMPLIRVMVQEQEKKNVLQTLPLLAWIAIAFLIVTNGVLGWLLWRRKRMRQQLVQAPPPRTRHMRTPGTSRHISLPGDRSSHPFDRDL